MLTDVIIDAAALLS